MPEVVYLLCAATCLACAVMLFRGYAKTRVALLFWSALCFVGLTVDNIVLYVDVIVVPEVDLTMIRRWPGLIAMLLLLYGLVWEAK